MSVLINSLGDTHTHTHKHTHTPGLIFNFIENRGYYFYSVNC